MNKYNVHMPEITFEWDNNKNKINKRKHAVSFEEACTAFYDEKAIQYFDPDHSDEEERFILLGISYKLKILVVCHCFRENDSVIRIISARKADKGEEYEYWRNRK
jgi:uncharacterized protein